MMVGMLVLTAFEINDAKHSLYKLAILFLLLPKPATCGTYRLSDYTKFHNLHHCKVPINKLEAVCTTAIHSLPQSIMYPFSCSFIRVSIQLFIQASMHPSMHAGIHRLIHSFIHSLAHSFFQDLFALGVRYVQSAALCMRSCFGNQLINNSDV